jgi:hypothetical protein
MSKQKNIMLRELLTNQINLQNKSLKMTRSQKTAKKSTRGKAPKSTGEKTGPGLVIPGAICGPNGQIDMSSRRQLHDDDKSKSSDSEGDENETNEAKAAQDKAKAADTPSMVHCGMRQAEK